MQDKNIGGSHKTFYKMCEEPRAGKRKDIGLEKSKHGKTDK